MKPENQVYKVSKNPLRKKKYISVVKSGVSGVLRENLDCTSNPENQTCERAERPLYRRKCIGGMRINFADVFYEVDEYITLIEHALWQIRGSDVYFKCPSTTYNRLVKNNPSLQSCFKQKTDRTFGPYFAITDSDSLFLFSCNRLSKLMNSSQELSSILKTFLSCVRDEWGWQITYNRLRDQYDQAYQAHNNSDLQNLTDDNDLSRFLLSAKKKTERSMQTVRDYLAFRRLLSNAQRKDLEPSEGSTNDVKSVKIHNPPLFPRQ